MAISQSYGKISKSTRSMSKKKNGSKNFIFCLGTTQGVGTNLSKQLLEVTTAVVWRGICIIIVMPRTCKVMNKGLVFQLCFPQRDWCLKDKENNSSAYCSISFHESQFSLHIILVNCTTPKCNPKNNIPDFTPLK